MEFNNFNLNRTCREIRLVVTPLLPLEEGVGVEVLDDSLTVMTRGMEVTVVIVATVAVLIMGMATVRDLQAIIKKEGYSNINNLLC